jgi:hypothetical protein
MSAAVVLGIVLAVVAVLVSGTAAAVSVQARRAAEAGSRHADALVKERTAALAALIDRRVATLAAQVASGVNEQGQAGAAPTPPSGTPAQANFEASPSAGPAVGPAPDQLYAYVEARLSQVATDLEALVADLLRRHARSVRQDALAAAAQAAAQTSPRH